MNNNSGRSGLFVAMVLVGLLILAASGVLIGMQAGNMTRQSAIEEELAEKKQYQEALAAAEREQAMKEAEEAAKLAAASAAATPTPTPIPPDKEISEADLGAIAEAIKGAGIAGTSTVFAYADAQKNAGISLNTNIQTSENAAQTAVEGLVTPTPQPAASKIICIDPGHQAEEMTDTEPNGPGSSDMKQMVTSGAYGEYSGKEEYEVVLEVGLKLRDILTSRGYTVVMTRETNDVSLSNVSRAQMATAANADIFVRLHCNDVEESEVTGVLCYGPASDNPYLTQEIIMNSQKLCELLRDNQCAVTGQKALNNLYQNDMTGINWATMPVSIVEMGFMSNETEDLFISSEEGENQIAEGLANGIDAYFAG